MMQGLHVSPSPQAAAEAVAQQLAQLMLKEAPQGRFSLALSGGSTPRLLYAHLASHFRTAIDWERVHIFWGDERCVSATDPNSNYLMARDSLLSKVAVQPMHVHRIPGEMTPPHKAAVVYTSMMQEFFRSDEMVAPEFDLILLGMGKDGHTASMFPGNVTLQEKTRWVTDVFAEGMTPPWRISLTLPVLQAARHVWFLVTGADKRPVLQQIIADPQAAAAHFPAALVQHTAPNVRWFVDTAAHG